MFELDHDTTNTYFRCSGGTAPPISSSLHLTPGMFRRHLTFACFVFESCSTIYPSLQPPRLFHSLHKVGKPDAQLCRTCVRSSVQVGTEATGFTCIPEVSGSNLIHANSYHSTVPHCIQVNTVTGDLS